MAQKKKSKRKPRKKRDPITGIEYDEGSPFDLLSTSDPFGTPTRKPRRKRKKSSTPSRKSNVQTHKRKSQPKKRRQRSHYDDSDSLVSDLNFGTPSEGIDLERVPPVGRAIAFGGVSYVITWVLGEFEILSVMNKWIIYVLITIAIGLYLYFEYASKGIQGLFQVGKGSGTSNGSENVEQTPQLSAKQKYALCQKMNNTCEMCSSSPIVDVHHITARSKGGSNEESNLIVLCPNCHRLADSGALSISRLQYTVNSRK